MKDSSDTFIFTTDLHRVRFHELPDHCAHILCLKGSMEFRYAERPFSAHSNAVVIIGSPALFTDLETSPDFECVAYIATHRFLEAQLPANHFGIGGSISLYNDPVIPLTDDETAWLEADIRAIGDRIDRHTLRFHNQMIGSLSLTMMYDLFEFHAARDTIIYSTDRALYVVKSLMNLLATGITERHRSVSYFARRLNVTPKYLSDTIRRQTGHCVGHFIDVHTIPIVRSYLDDSALSVTMIAERMNFSSATYFARYVRRILGQSPKEYRRSRMPGKQIR